MTIKSRYIRHLEIRRPGCRWHVVPIYAEWSFPCADPDKDFVLSGLLSEAELNERFNYLEACNYRESGIPDMYYNANEALAEVRVAKNAYALSLAIAYTIKQRHGNARLKTLPWTWGRIWMAMPCDFIYQFPPCDLEQQKQKLEEDCKPGYCYVAGYLGWQAERAPESADTRGAGLHCWHEGGGVLLTWVPTKGGYVRWSLQQCLDHLAEYTELANENEYELDLYNYSDSSHAGQIRAKGNQLLGLTTLMENARVPLERMMRTYDNARDDPNLKKMLRI